MSYSFSTRKGTAASATIPTQVPLAGYTALTVEFSHHADFATTYFTKTPTGNPDDTVAFSLTATEVDTIGDAYFRVRGTKAGKTDTLQDGTVDYTFTRDSASVSLSGPVSLAGPIDTNPHAAGDLIKTVQNKIRHEFTGSAVDTNFWTVTTGPGMVVGVTASELRIDTNTTANSVTTIRSKISFSGAYRVMFVSAGALLSQRIANQEFELRVVNAAGTSYASWLLNGTVATTGIARAFNNGTSVADQTQSAIPTTAAPVILELENFIDEVYFHTRLPESTNGRTTSAVKNRQTPDPTEDMFIEIVVRNLATAPASSTRLSLDAVLVQDISELTTEITGGRGGGGLSQAIPVAVTGTAIVNANGSQTTSLIVHSAGDPLTVTNLGVSGIYAQTGVDTGATVGIRPTRIRPVVMHTAGFTPGILVLEESSDGTTFRETWRQTIPSDGLYHSFEVPLHLRWYRVRFLNSTVAQTAFWLSVELLRGDGATDIDKVLTFPLTAAAGQALGAAAVFTGPTIDLGGNHLWDTVRAAVRSDVANATSGLGIQQSMDGTNWHTLATGVNLAAGSAVLLEQPIVERYIRIINTQGATAGTAFFAALTLYTN